MRKVILTLMLLFLCIIIFKTIILNELIAQERIMGEIILGAQGTGGDGWYYEWYADPETRWWSDHKITNQYYSGETPTFYREDDEAFALNSPDDEGDYNVAYGNYRFTFHCDQLNIHEDFELDLRDANWATTQPPYPYPVDLYIRWNNNVGYKKFQYRSSGNWEDLGYSEAIWDLWGISTPKQDVFQPTPPLSLKCTNPNETGAHPDFTWSPPIWPGHIEKKRHLTIYYWVYRNGRCVAKNLTSCSWTDPWVKINPNGSNLTYSVKASLAHSPMSDPSNSVSIKGGLLKQYSDETFQEADSTEISTESRSNLSSAFPNPFNLSTTIKFEIPTTGRVKLEIYNSLGKKIQTLIDGKRSVGNYEITWDGQNKDGVTMPSGVYLYTLTINNHREVRKMILTK